MAKQRQNICLEKSLLDRVGIFAHESLFWTRTALVTAILEEWMKGKKALLQTKPTPLTAPLDAIEEAAERCRIVTAWRNFIKHRRHARNEATGEFLIQLYRFSGRDVSRPTLYLWAKRYRIGGPDALLDRRKFKTTSNSLRRASKTSGQRLQRAKTHAI